MECNTEMKHGQKYRNVSNVVQAMTSYCNNILFKSMPYSEDFITYMESVFFKNGYRNYAVDDRNILIIHDGGIGDLIMFSPALRIIREIYPNSYITLLVTVGTEGVVSSCPYIDKVITNPFKCDSDNKKNIINAMSISQLILPDSYDVAFVYAEFTVSFFIAYLCGAKKRIGWINRPKERCIFQNMDSSITDKLINIPIVGNEKYVHSVDIYLGLIEEYTKRHIEDRSIEVWYTPRELQKMYKRIASIPHKKCIIVSFGGELAAKLWPVEKYILLAKKIIKTNKDILFVVVGGEKDRYISDIFKDALPYSNVLNLAGDVSITETAAVLAISDMYIGNDTCTMHIASANKIPVLAMFSYPASQGLTGYSTLEKCAPYDVPAVGVIPENALDDCISRKYHLGCIHNKPHCICQITVEKAFEGYEFLKNKIEAGEHTVDYIY